MSQDSQLLCDPLAASLTLQMLRDSQTISLALQMLRGSAGNVAGFADALLIRLRFR